MEDYRDRMKAYHVQELPKRIQRFEACATPTEEAKCDASLFLRKYFLDEDGNPDRTKTPDLMLLPGYDKHLVMTGYTERVPALHVADGGLGGASNVMVIGWDRARVNNKAHQIDMRQSPGRGILRLSHDWDRQMIRHRTYVEKFRNQAEIFGPKVGSSFETRNIRGIYVVKCEAIQHDWPLLSKQLRLKCVRNGRLAVFDLGIVVGLMVLDRTQEDVTKILQDGNWDVDPITEDIENEDESEDGSSDEEDSDDEQASGHSEDSDYNVREEPDTPTDLTLYQPAKRQKIESSHPRRLHFQWRGYNTISGAIQFDPHNRNTGYLDFANDDATVFEAKILMDAIGGEIAFQGYKVPGLGGPLTMNWNALSHLASERAKVPEYRW